MRIGLAALAISVLGVVAYGAAHTVSDHPAPQVIIPALRPSEASFPHDAHEVSKSDGPKGDGNGTLGGGNRIPTTTTVSIPPSTVSHSDDGARDRVGEDNGRKGPSGSSSSGSGSSSSGTGSSSGGPSGSPSGSGHAGGGG